MLVNISEKVCVQKYTSSYQTQWACYEPFELPAQKKRCSWKKVSGLMSAAEMSLWLEDRYPDSDHAKHFSNVPNRL